MRATIATLYTDRRRSPPPLIASKALRTVKLIYELEFCLFCICSYYSNEVDNYGSPYGYSQSVATPLTIGYDISADFVDSTTAYEPRNNTIIDADFIGMHSMYCTLKSTHWISNVYLLFLSPSQSILISR